MTKKEERKKNKVFGVLYFIRTQNDIEAKDVLKIASEVKLFGMKGSEMKPVVLHQDSFINNPDSFSPAERVDEWIRLLRDIKSIIQNKADFDEDRPDWMNSVGESEEVVEAEVVEEGDIGDENDE